MSTHNENSQEYDDQIDTTEEGYEDDSYTDGDAYSEDSSEEWADDAEAGDDSAADSKPKKKKSSLTTIIIIVVAVVGVLGFLAMSGGGGQQAPQQTSENQVIDADASLGANPVPAGDSVENLKAEADQGNVLPSAPVEDKANQQESAAPQGILDNPASFDQAQPEQKPEDSVETSQEVTVNANASGDTPITVAPAVPEGSVEQPKSADLTAPIPPEVNPVSDFPTVDAIKKQEAPVVSDSSASATIPDVAPVAAAIPAPVADAPVATNDMTPQVDAQIAAMKAQLEEAQSKISGLEKSLEEKNAEIVAAKESAVQAVSNTAEIDSLKEKIAELEAKLETKASSPVVPEREAIVETADSVASVKTVDMASSTKNVTSVPKKQVSRVLWELKGVSGGRALLADKSTGDTKSVSVGDTVSGLGKILSIRQSDTAWVVKGTLGIVSE